MPASQSFWLDSLPASAQTRRTTPQLPARTQAAVIGGSLTGASLAYWLRQFGIDVTLLERRGLSGGAAGRNGGHLVSGPALDFAEAVQRYGADSARAIYQFTLDTIADLQTFIREHTIDCDLELNGHATLALDSDDLTRLERTAHELARHNLPVQWWDAATCAERTRSNSFLGGCFNPVAGTLWPAKLVLGLATVAEQLGANLQTETAVRSVRREGAGFIIETDRGDLRADCVAYALNAWARDLLPELAATIVPVRGQVIATEPAPRQWPFGWGTNHGYEYCIQRPDGRIVLGGMRWKSATLEVGEADDSSLNPELSPALRAFLPEHFPALKDIRIESEWTGIMAFTPDHNPLVGPLPERPGEYIAAGYSGHGMPIAFNAARAVAEHIAGKQPSMLIEAFSPKRFL